MCVVRMYHTVRISPYHTVWLYQSYTDQDKDYSEAMRTYKGTGQDVKGMQGRRDRGVAGRGQKQQEHGHDALIRSIHVTG